MNKQTYKLEIRKSVIKILKKLKRKNKVRYETAQKKIKEILRNPHRYKNLKAPLQHLKRVHFGPFVLTFSIDEKTKTIILEDYRHHDEIYKVK